MIHVAFDFKKLAFPVNEQFRGSVQCHTGQSRHRISKQTLIAAEKGVTKKRIRIRTDKDVLRVRLKRGQT